MGSYRITRGACVFTDQRTHQITRDEQRLRRLRLPKPGEKDPRPGRDLPRPSRQAPWISRGSVMESRCNEKSGTVSEKLPATWETTLSPGACRPVCSRPRQPTAERRMPRNASEDVDFQRLGRVRHRGQGRRRARSDMERSSLVAIKTRGGHIQNVAKTSIWRELFGFDRNGIV